MRRFLFTKEHGSPVSTGFVMLAPQIARSETAENAPRTKGKLSEIISAHALVQDLLHPQPKYYWMELLLTGTAAWAAFLLAISQPFGESLMWVALAAATFLFFRASIFIHELTHRRRDDIPGFHPAWNLSIGVPLLLPSILYEGIHKDHHSKATYGTVDDPEYLPFASRPELILKLLLLSFTGPLLLFVRFVVFAPIGWFVPPFRRWLDSRLSTFGFNFAYRRKMTAEQRRSMRNWEAIIVCVWWPLLGATAAEMLPWHWLPIWLVMITAIASVNHIRELIAHRYESDGQPVDFPSQLIDSINTPGSTLTALWAPLGLRYHALHHLFPGLPYHNLGEAHRRLTKSLPTGAAYHTTHNSSLASGLLNLIRIGRRGPG